jgi:hypothetical protein
MRGEKQTITQAKSAADISLIPLLTKRISISPSSASSTRGLPRLGI